MNNLGGVFFLYQHQMSIHDDYFLPYGHRMDG